MNKTASVLLIPGTENRADVAFSGLAPLLERDWTVHTVDFASDSTLSGDSQLDNYSEQIANYVVKNIAPNDELHICGYSLGSLIATRYASNVGERIASLTLLAGWLNSSPQQTMRHDLWLKLYGSEPKLAGEFSHVLQHSPQYLQLLNEQQTPMMSKTNAPNDETQRRVVVNRDADNTRAAAAITCPTLVINGTNDLKVPIFCGYELVGAIANAKLSFVDSGHAMLLERLGEVYGLFSDFIGGLNYERRNDIKDGVLNV